MIPVRLLRLFQLPKQPKHVGSNGFLHPVALAFAPISPTHCFQTDALILNSPGSVLRLSLRDILTWFDLSLLNNPMYLVLALKAANPGSSAAAP
jgi:hypothetical protein